MPVMEQSLGYSESTDKYSKAISVKITFVDRGLGLLNE